MASGAGERLRARAAESEAKVAEEQRQLDRSLDEHAGLAAQRDAALARLRAADEAKARAAEGRAASAQRLEEEQGSRASLSKRYQELQEEHEAALLEMKECQARVRELAQELEEGRRLRGAEEASCLQLRRRHDDLEFEKQRQQKRHQELAGTLKSLRALISDGAGKHAELAAEREALERSQEESARRLVEAAEAHEVERRLCAEQTEAVPVLRAELEQLSGRQRSCSEARQRLAEDSRRAAGARELEARRAEELGVRLDAVAPAQQELQRKHDAAVEQLQGLEGEKHRTSVQKDELLAALSTAQEAVELARRSKEQAKRAIEEAGPTQLSAGDVLISVAFHGVPQPLELMPWDTNLEAVVTKWLTATQRSIRLQPSVVRYLTHLEETAEAFPVRVEASLLDVHEEFAL
mmetsp:Transcript_66694/g.188464  ORF Transcript_66694/g.188464 Transcript_66694/m.188464 type:complete len:409 (+) Transcript_66694:1-1227(+)